MKRSLLFGCLLTAAALPVAAQNQPPQKTPLQLDRIVAVVADTILLDSDVQEQLAMLKAGGQPVPTDSAGLQSIRRQIIDGLIEKLVLLHAAKRDTTVKVDDSKVDAEVERQVEQRKQQFGGQAPFETALSQQRLTLAQFKDMLGADVRKEMMQQLYLQKIFGKRKPPPLTDKALQDEFEKAKNTLQERPATISFTQVVMSASSDSAKKVARLKADSILTLIRAGQDFATLAKRFSDDDASKDQGGDLGWQRSSMWVPEFSAALMRLRPGEVSGVVETQYGFHIIKLEKVRGAESQARHILIKPATSDEGAAEVTAKATKIADKIKAGADIDSIARSVGDPDERPRIGPYEVAKLGEGIDPAYRQNLTDAKTGQVIGPFRIGGAAANTPEKVVVLKVTDVREAGKFSWDDPDFRMQFRRSIEQRQLIEEIIAELKKQTFIDIRS